MNKPLMTLEEHNKGVAYKRASPRKNGIACPECGEELFDTDSSTILLSNPPQQGIHCESCDYKGYRYV